VQSHQPIGVFDSGIGGLTVAAEIQALLPHEPIVYFGDADRCPYGNRDPEEVIQFSLQICDFLLTQKVKMIVVACNTATATALSTLTAHYDVPVIGVIQPGSRAAVKAPSVAKVGVIGTTVTIQSGAYASAIFARNPELQVYGLACPAFVPLVESGQLDGADVEAIVAETLLPMQREGVDAVILGCTHYPLLQPVIARVLGPTVRLISSAEETAIEVKQLLASHVVQESVGVDLPIHQYFTSGDAGRMQTALQEWYGRTNAQVQTLSLAQTKLR
jgi:glutamate racemase